MFWPRLDIVDPLESDAVQWSFNDRLGETNPDGVRSKLSAVRFGVETAIGTFEPASAPGGDVVSHRDGIWRSAVHFLPSAVDADALAQGLDVLSSLMVRPGEMLYQREQGSDELRVDFLRSPRFALMRGQHLPDLARDDEGITIEFLQKPGLREPRREAALNLWGNGSMLADANRDGTPDLWTLEAGTHSIADEAFRISHNAAADLIRRDFTAAAATQVAVSIEARKVSGDRTVEIQLISRASDAVLDTATVTGVSWTRYEVSGAVAGGDTGVRVRVRYTGGSTTTVAEFRDSQLETGTLVASPFRVGPEAVSMDPAAVGGRSLVLVNPGKMWAPYELTIAAESGGTPKIEEIEVSLRAGDGVEGHRDLASYLNETRFAQLDATANGWTVTFGADTSQVADGDASGAFAAECTYSTVEDLAQRVRIERTTLLDSLRGYYRVTVRVKPSAASQHRIQLRSAPSLAEPVPYVEPAVEPDWSDAATFAYEEIDLGVFYLTEDPGHDLAGFALEVFSERISGTGTLRFDCIPQITAVDPLYEDSISVLTVPGSSKDSWKGKDLIEPTVPTGLDPGAVKNQRIRLNAANEWAGTPPVTGLPWPVGRHKVTFFIDGNGKLDFTCRVWNITDGAVAISRAFSDRKPARVAEVTIQFDSVAAKSYQPQIGVTGGVAVGEYLDVKRIRHVFVPYLGASEQMVTDPEKAFFEKRDASGNVLSYLGLDGAIPLWAPPGRSVVTLRARALKVHSGATEGESKITHDFIVAAFGAPRRPI